MNALHSSVVSQVTLATEADRLKNADRGTKKRLTGPTPRGIMGDRSYLWMAMLNPAGRPSVRRLQLAFG